MRASKKHFPSLSAASRETGIAPATLRKWRDKEKIDVLDPAAVEKRRGFKQPRPAAEPATADTAESYGEARRRREIAAANRMEIIAQREAGAVIDLASVEAAFAQVGAEFRSRLLAMRGNLVTELEGQSAENIYRILDVRIGELLESIHNLSKP
ncbi:MAG: hypothetical protein MUF86_00380 [Akkermansiaceae bacterium]|jgi:transposase-like protein|nr:hypothetical protein [Akkermansiaceae bacterium]MCU0776110.1 hypothetical protein [Akkermansiaceae bacterium]